MHVFIGKRYTYCRTTRALSLFDFYGFKHSIRENIIFNCTPLERKLQQMTTFSVINIIVYVNVVI